jgi:hypothetical protein
MMVGSICRGMRRASFEGYEMSLVDMDLGIPGLAVGSAPGSAVQSEAGDPIQDDSEGLNSDDNDDDGDNDDAEF